MKKYTFLKSIFKSIINSYSLVFFSNNIILSFIIIFVTFFEIKSALIGLLFIILSNIFSKILKFSIIEIESGVWGFNALFLGLLIGNKFEINSYLLLLIPFLVLINLFLTLIIKGFLEKIELPFLTLPFIISNIFFNIILTSLKNIKIDETKIYALNQIAKNQNNIWYKFSHSLDNYITNNNLKIYLNSISNIFFQENILAGLLISIGIFIHSRILFLFSIITVFCALLLFNIFSVENNLLPIYIININIIFFSFAIGAYYFIPNLNSILIVIFLSPFIFLITLIFQYFFLSFQFQILTLPFCILSIIILYLFKKSYNLNFLQKVIYNSNSPEINLYEYYNSNLRFGNKIQMQFILPFYGDWFVSQGYNGSKTHLGLWKNALDFVIIDEEKKTFTKQGLNKEDFYCYNKPILAPASGYIYDIINHVNENDIGKIDKKLNWGNSIIINHTNGLFSQISHLKKESILVNIGDYVYQGTQIATCGNSGRSPEPHIHFQIQKSPQIGAATIEYPFTYFIEKNNNKLCLQTNKFIKENSIVSNLETCQLIKQSFLFLPNQKYNVTTNLNQIYYWEIFTDAYNNSYIYCNQSKSTAYFVNDGCMFYFTKFYGDKKSPLFTFYISNYKILLGYYPTINIVDNISLQYFQSLFLKYIQDLIIPFYKFTKIEYLSKNIFIDNIINPKKIKFLSQIKIIINGKLHKSKNFEIEINENKYIKIVSQELKKHIKIEMI